MKIEQIPKELILLEISEICEVDGCFNPAEYWWQNIINDQVEARREHLAVCVGPVSFPPERIYRKGFQGFRYTEDFW